MAGKDGSRQLESRKVNDLLLTIQGLEQVILVKKEELEQMNIRRISVITEITDVEMDGERRRSQQARDLNLRNQKFESDIKKYRSNLNNQEEHLTRWNKQLESREKEARIIEDERQVFEKNKRDLQNKALTIESLRIQAQLDVEAADQVRSELDGKREEILFIQSENKTQILEIQKWRDKLAISEASIGKMSDSLELRKETIDEASKAIQPKLIEIKERENKLSLLKDELANKEEDVNAIQARVEQAEDILIHKQKEISKRSEIVQSQEQLEKQRKLEQLVREEGKEQVKEEEKPVLTVYKSGKKRGQVRKIDV